MSNELDIVFPVHPRTRQHIAELGVDSHKLRLVQPMPYIEFLSLQTRAAVVITDSGVPDCGYCQRPELIKGYQARTDLVNRETYGDAMSDRS